MTDIYAIILSRLGTAALILVASLVIMGCTQGPAKRVNTPTGPLTATAKNRFVQEDPDALRRAALGFERGGQHSSALNLYLQLSAQYPNDRESALGIARCLIALGQKREGTLRLESLYTEAPEDRQVRQALLDAYMKSVQIEKAETMLAPLVANESATQLELLQFGVLNEVLGRPLIARQIWDEVRGSDTGNVVASRYIAISFALDKEYETAVALLQGLLDNPETDSVGRETLSYIYALSGQTDAAIAIASSVLSAEEVDQRRTLFKLLPTLSRREQATGILLNRVSADTIRRLTQPANPS